MNDGVVSGRGKETKSDKVSRALEKMAKELGAGERLPSVRTLCQSLEISLATLNTAMRGLEIRGLIERRHGSGVYVTDKVLLKRVAVVANSGFLLAGGSPVWGMLLGELMARLPEGETEAAIFLATPSREGGLPRQLPTDFLYAVEQGRIDGVIAIGLEGSAVENLEKSGIPIVSFSGSGGWNFKMNIIDMAGQLAKIYVSEGQKTAIVTGCTSAPQWEDCCVVIEKAGLRVIGESGSYWRDQGLVERMSNPFFHYGQDFAVNLSKVVQEGDKPDVLFLMDDVFAHGFLMVWRNSPYRDEVELACHSNRELRMYRGWEGRLGLMEVEVMSLAQVLVDAVMLQFRDPLLNGKELAEALGENREGLTLETKIDGAQVVTTVCWNAHFLS